MNKQLLLGDEALAQGALDAGLSGVYAYPGTPSTEITEYIQAAPEQKERAIHSRWSANEKTAMEAALGMSFAGKRALVCMKHVGMNVAADCFVNAGITGVRGGLIVVAADDPGMHSSQNEQDSRFYGDFALVPIFEPSNQQEAYDMAYHGFDFSEQTGEPVLMRLVTRLAHSRAGVERLEPQAPPTLAAVEDARQFVLLPGIARRRYHALLEKQADLLKASEESPYNSYVDGNDKSVGIVACGIGGYLQPSPEGREAYPGGGFGCAPESPACSCQRTIAAFCFPELGCRASFGAPPCFCASRRFSAERLPIDRQRQGAIGLGQPLRHGEYFVRQF